MTRVMVVDDHPMWRDAVERDLQAAGHEVVGVASNGREAMARFPAAAPQVVVLDLQLPDHSGVQVTSMMLEHDPTARVLILSAMRRNSPSTRPARPGVKTVSPSATRLTASMSSALEADFTR